MMLSCQCMQLFLYLGTFVPVPFVVSLSPSYSSVCQTYCDSEKAWVWGYCLVSTDGQI